MQQLEDLCKDKDGLNQLADELRGKSTDVQMHDVDHKTADADEKFGQLQDAINNRYLFIIRLICFYVGVF